MSRPPARTVVSTASRKPLLDVLKRTPFVQHPVAVILSVILATLLIILIRQNLENEEIFRGEVDVVTQATDKGRQIVVGVSGDFILEPLTPRTNIVIRGVFKEKAANPVMDAFVPSERLNEVGNDWQTVTLGGKDLSIQGSPSLTFELLGALKVRVARIREGQLSFTYELQNEDRDREYKVEFDPPVVTARAPAPFFGDADRRSVSIPVDVAQAEQHFDRVAWPERPGQVVMLKDAVTVRVTSTAVQPGDPVEISDVRAAFLMSSGSPFEAQFAGATPGANYTVDVKVHGPARELEALRNDAARRETLRQQLRVVFDFEPEALARRQQIEQAGEKGLRVNVRGRVSGDVVRRLGFTSVEPSRPVEDVLVRMRKQ